MAFGDLKIVKRWLDAVNHGDLPALLEVTADDIAIAESRGVEHGKDVLAAWLRRAGYAAHAARWFCGQDGIIVVEQEAAWSSMGAPQGCAHVASAFVVEDARVRRFQRFDDVDSALSAYGLRPSDEVTTHAP